ncbi:type VI secretion system Vgr family protein [Stenotrophomonas tumulicola]|uniref:Type VI secretion system tip protein VgrG n=1 Tax=Stenotrophomonas tumulicola TaxID=1685415 RepID=A0A7W3IGC3_9GAMM|nr:type VI secretion system Vgr family protein [Stenotrophomonas tumulicola]MBA8680765.1 type VI secretion system tip protein VgrG [Stenotrophomonas tumulicola]
MDIAPPPLVALAVPSQQARLIQLQAPVPGLVVEHLQGSEAVCAPFRFEIDCLSTRSDIDLDALLEQPLTLQLRRDDGSLRAWNGLCTDAAFLGGDGGLTRLRLTLQPWTALLALRRNAVIFQDLDVRAVCERIFAQYPQASFRFDVQQALPARAITTQYRESDWDFLTRLLAESGLAWRFDHADGQDGGTHTLVVFDTQAELADAGTLRFHRSDIAEATDAITAFGAQRRVTPSALSVGSWHSERLTASSGQGQAEAGLLPPLEVHVQPRAGRFGEGASADDEAQYRLDGLRVASALHAGGGSVRALASGSTFALGQHPQHAGQRFTVLAIEHSARNNLDPGINVLLGREEMEPGSYRNRFVVVPEGTALRALPTDRPTLHGPLTARVVGQADAAVTPTRDHQVRIQFAWQRGSAPNAGGLDASDGHAPGDATSGTWVPVAEWVAGPNWGTHFLPRIGAEVLVEFLHGDIDQPRVTGQLYNGEVAPPFGGGLQGEANHPGTLSGLHSTAHDGNGSQQWLLDDTPGQLRTRLHTSLADSTLQLGYLLQGGDASRGALRGQGFELATGGWGNVHAAQGLLLSTTARAQATSTQLDAAEAVAQIKGAQRTSEALHDALQAQQVPGLEGLPGIETLHQGLDPTADGRYSGSVGGQAAMKPGSDGRTAGDTPVERFAEARVLAESPDHIAWTTPNSSISHAGQNLQLTAQDDLHAVAGRTLAATVGQHAALFAQAGPLKVIAAAGAVSLQAHTGELELLADQAVTITATDTRIDVLAQQKIVLQAGQSRITLEGGDITFACPGNFTVKASEHPFLGGASADHRLSLPNGLVNVQPQRFFDFSD